MIDPLFHLAVIFPKRILVIVIEVHIPRKLHDGRTPVGRRNAAQAAARRDHERNAGLLIGKIELRVVEFLMQRILQKDGGRRADVGHVLGPEITHVVIEALEREHGMRVAEPAATLAVGTVGRQTVRIAQHRAYGHLVQTVDLLIGTLEAAAPGHVGMHDDRPEPRGIRLRRRAGKLQVAEAVIRETRSPCLAPGPLANVFVGLYHTGSADAGRPIIDRAAVVVEPLAHAHPKAGALRLLDGQPGYGGHVDAEIENPVAGGILPHGYRSDFLLEPDRLHDLRNQARGITPSAGTNALPISGRRSRRSPAGDLAVRIVRLAGVEVRAQHRSRSPRPRTVGRHDPLRAVLVGNLHLQQQHRLAVTHACAPHFVLIVPAVAEHHADASYPLFRADPSRRTCCKTRTARNWSEQGPTRGSRRRADRSDRDRRTRVPTYRQRPARAWFRNSTHRTPCADTAWGNFRPTRR